MHAYKFHTGKPYFVVSGCSCDPLATDVITGSIGIALLITRSANRFDDPVPTVLLKIKERKQ
jgi:hypothetical protein